MAKTKTMQRGKYKRVPREGVRERMNRSAAGQRWLALPKDVRQWTPEQAGRYLIDIVPYKVDSNLHPEGFEPDTLWWRLEFRVHRNIGVDNESVVCPASLGKKCPICADVAALKRDYEKNRDQIRALRPKEVVAYNILDPDDKDKIAVFVYSKFNFGDVLKEQLDDDDENIGFFDTGADGRTLQVKFVEDKFEGHKFLKAVRFDFRDRGELDEDEIIEKTVCLERALSVLPFEEIKKMYLQLDETDEVELDAESEDEDDERQTKRPSRAADDEDEDDGNDDDDDDENDEDEDDSDDDDDDDENDEDEDDSDDEDNDESEDDDSDEDEDDSDEDDDEDDEPPAKRSAGKAPARRQPVKPDRRR